MQGARHWGRQHGAPGGILSDRSLQPKPHGPVRSSGPESVTDPGAYAGSVTSRELPHLLPTSPSSCQGPGTAAAGHRHKLEASRPQGTALSGAKPTSQQEQSSQLPRPIHKGLLEPKPRLIQPLPAQSRPMETVSPPPQQEELEPWSRPQLVGRDHRGSQRPGHLP